MSAAMVRCPTCGFPAVGHFVHSGRNQGMYRGCPARLTSAAVVETRPCFMVRVGKSPETRGHVFAQWAECWVDDEAGGSVLLWDLRTGEQQWRGENWVRNHTAKANTQQRAEAQDAIELELGCKVRITQRPHVRARIAAKHGDDADDGTRAEG